jgi:hypothetical protein
MKQLAYLLAILLQAPESSVEGIAVRAGTTDPVPHARVMLTKIDGGLHDLRVAEADDRGRFAVRGVGPGSYHISAQHDAFVRADGVSVAVAAGQAIRGVTVEMTPTAVITGRILDEFGDPVARVYVRATLKESTFETMSNDLGEYRLHGLRPGSYILSAAPYLDARLENGRLIIPTPPSPYGRGEGQGMMGVGPLLQTGNFIPFMALRGEMHPRVYYPGTTDLAAATTIEIPAGAVMPGFNLAVSVRRAGP